MSNYLEQVENLAGLATAANGVSAEQAVRMRLQNQFKTGLDVARYTADIMRRDLDAYDADTSQYTQSLGCWHGFIGQQ
ncbi:MAG: isocitrate lyase, partial [Luminiphilus sp.]|nr:isocitrate lyase [Luminiphilus sp.]